MINADVTIDRFHVTTNGMHLVELYARGGYTVTYLEFKKDGGGGYPSTKGHKRNCTGEHLRSAGCGGAHYRMIIDNLPNRPVSFA